MMKCLLFLLCSCIITACGGGSSAPGALKKLSATPVPLHLLDTLEQKMQLAEIVRPEKFIALQVPETEVIAKVDQVLVHEGNFICMDRKFSSLLVFDSNGRFIKKIGRLGKGAGKYLSIENVFIDDETQQLNVFSNSSRELVRFSLTGNSTSSLPLGFNGWRCLPLEKDHYAFYLNFLGIINNHHNLFITDRKGNMIIEDIEYPKLIQSAFDMSGTITPSAKGYLLAPAFSDTIYYGTAESLVPAYVLGLGQQKVPVQALINTAEFTTAGKDFAYAGPEMLDMPGALFFNYINGLTEQFAVYDKKNSRLYTPGRVQRNVASVLFAAPVGRIGNNRVITALYPSIFPYFEKGYPAFTSEVKKEYPELFSLLQNRQAQKQVILAVYNIQQ